MPHLDLGLLASRTRGVKSAVEAMLPKQTETGGHQLGLCSRRSPARRPVSSSRPPALPSNVRAPSSPAINPSDTAVRVEPTSTQGARELLAEGAGMVAIPDLLDQGPTWVLCLQRTPGEASLITTHLWEQMPGSHPARILPLPSAPLAQPSRGQRSVCTTAVAPLLWHRLADADMETAMRSAGTCGACPCGF